jgi:hypothetical protein
MPLNDSERDVSSPSAAVRAGESESERELTELPSELTEETELVSELIEPTEVVRKLAT